jgi:hypothetical protein
MVTAQPTREGATHARTAPQRPAPRRTAPQRTGAFGAVQRHPLMSGIALLASAIARQIDVDPDAAKASAESSSGCAWCRV